MSGSERREIKYLELENERLTAQIAALRMCCIDVRDILNGHLERHKETPVGATHKALNVDIPKILNATR